MSDRSFARRQLIGYAGLLAAALTVALAPLKAPARTRFEVRKTPEEWRRQLGRTRYRILREAGTERAYSSPLNSEKRRGTFVCAGCGLPLFASATKFDSRTGWPSFFKPLANAVVTKTDRTLGMSRTEVLCRRCGGHLGHVFNDGPRPAGLRYCINGLSMRFRAA